MYIIDFQKLNPFIMCLHVIRIWLCFQVELSIKLIQMTKTFAPLWIIMCPKSNVFFIYGKGLKYIILMQFT
jgi:hypothetical protein